MIKAIIFDLDGVLVDATEWHYEALNEALRLFGYEITREEHLKVYNGLPTVEKLNMLTQQQGLPLGLHSVIKAMKRGFTDSRVEQLCKPSHEKQLMLKHLKKNKYMLAVCSNAQKYSVINMLQRSQIEGYFDLIMGNDEGFSPKPAPDIYLEAFKKLGVKPEEVIIVEDAPHGIQAAKASGALVIEVKGYDDVTLELFDDLYRYNSKSFRLEQFNKGWFIGDFEKALHKTKDFEVALKPYIKGDKEPRHHHRIATEYTAVVYGAFRMEDTIYRAGEIVCMYPNQSTDFECIESGATVVVKVPSVPEDKYLS